MHILLPAIVFVLTLFVIYFRPWRLNEGWAASIGAALMLILKIETLPQALHAIGKAADVLLFLLGLLILSNQLRDSGFFDWSAVIAARSARGDGKRLYRNVFLLGAVTTALLSLDTTAVILTPIVLTFVNRLKLNAKPFVLACAFVANTGSLLLPVSNLTNLLFVSAFHWSFSGFAEAMLLPQAAVLLSNYWLFSKMFATEISGDFQTRDLPLPAAVITKVRYFRGSTVILLIVLSGYFIGSLLHFAPFVFALGGSGLMLVWGALNRQSGWKPIRDVTWSVFPFVIGLFVVVGGIEHTMITAGFPPEQHISSSLKTGFVTAFGSAMGSNVINNIPMALLEISGLGHPEASNFARYAALLGCNIGPNITLTGSLATMLVIASARKHGVDIAAREFFKAGIVVTPILLVVGVISLWAAHP